MPFISTAGKDLQPFDTRFLPSVAMTQPLAMTQPPTVIQRGAARRNRRIHDFWNFSFLNCLFLNCLFLNCLSSQAKGEVAMTQPIEMT